MFGTSPYHLGASSYRFCTSPYLFGTSSYRFCTSSYLFGTSSYLFCTTTYISIFELHRSPRASSHAEKSPFRAGFSPLRPRSARVRPKNTQNPPAALKAARRGGMATRRAGRVAGPGGPWARRYWHPASNPFWKARKPKIVGAMIPQHAGLARDRIARPPIAGRRPEGSTAGRTGGVPRGVRALSRPPRPGARAWPRVERTRRPGPRQRAWRSGARATACGRWRSRSGRAGCRTSRRAWRWAAAG